MLTSAGVKLVDFGLAKAIAPTNVESAPTAGRSLTMEGTVVGTLQVHVARADGGQARRGAERHLRARRRALRMAAGRRAFTGDTAPAAKSYLPRCKGTVASACPRQAARPRSRSRRTRRKVKYAWRGPRFCRTVAATSTRCRRAPATPRCGSASPGILPVRCSLRGRTLFTSSLGICCMWRTAACWPGASIRSPLR